jgi:hypothetical protein
MGLFSDQIVSGGFGDVYGVKGAGGENAVGPKKYRAVDFRRVGCGAGDKAAFCFCVDQYGEFSTDQCVVSVKVYVLLQRHNPLRPPFSDFLRDLIRQLLEATRAGLGGGETAIFPVQIFKVKDGVNANEGEANYDLFRLAMQTSAERLFPNFSFLDAPFNAQYYKEGNPDTEVAYMGCRTRVMARCAQLRRLRHSAGDA